MTAKTVRDVLDQLCDREIDDLGIDPDAVLTEDCPTCGGYGETERLVDPQTEDVTPGPFISDPCPNPDCDNGTVEKARIMVVPVEVAEWLDSLTSYDDLRAALDIDEPTADELADLHAAIAADNRALRIGRAVLAWLAEFDHEPSRWDVMDWLVAGEATTDCPTCKGRGLLGGQTGFHYDYPVPCTNPACRNGQVAAGEATP